MMAYLPEESRRSVFESNGIGLEKCVNSNGANCLRAPQLEALQKCSAWLKDQNRLPVTLCVLPTGVGKTGVMVLTPYFFRAKRVLVITPSEAITMQDYNAFVGRQVGGTAEYADSFLERCGLLDKKHRVTVLPATGGLVTRGDGTYGWLQSEICVTNAHRLSPRNVTTKIQDIPRDIFDLVIVDEAHHYPVTTWRLVVNHFTGAKKLFLTATPFHKRNPIFEDCTTMAEQETRYVAFTITKQAAVNGGYIRGVEFVEIGDEKDDVDKAMRMVGEEIRNRLNQHNHAPDKAYQAMVLCQTKDTRNSAASFQRIFNDGLQKQSPQRCEVFVCGSNDDLPNQFKLGKFQVLVVVGRLREGYDNPNVSVIGICRNLQTYGLFEQMVGRAVRKPADEQDITACVVSHKLFKQRDNWKRYEEPELPEYEEDEDTGED